MLELDIRWLDFNLNTYEVIGNELEKAVKKKKGVSIEHNSNLNKLLGLYIAMKGIIKKNKIEDNGFSIKIEEINEGIQKIYESKSEKLYVLTKEELDTIKEGQTLIQNYIKEYNQENIESIMQNAIFNIDCQIDYFEEMVEEREKIKLSTAFINMILDLKSSIEIIAAEDPSKEYLVHLINFKKSKFKEIKIKNDNTPMIYLTDDDIQILKRLRNTIRDFLYAS